MKPLGEPSYFWPNALGLVIGKSYSK